jgi:NAD+ synthase (glutamine-hydrolysing)
LLRWIIKLDQFGSETGKILQSILDTEISPELIPQSQDSEDPQVQSTESLVGPYELQDFNLYYLTRLGYRPSKVAYLSFQAWGDRRRGSWPELIGEDRRNEYDLATIKKWLQVFLYRFFKISQFKRSALPNGPKVGSGGSLSPRGDWRAPSDSEADIWLTELEQNVPK